MMKGTATAGAFVAITLTSGCGAAPPDDDPAAWLLVATIEVRNTVESLSLTVLLGEMQEECQTGIGRGPTLAYGVATKNGRAHV